MNRTRIGAVTPGARYRISGFVENLRNKKKMAFLVIRDISGKLQVTVEKEKNAELAALVDQLTLAQAKTQAMAEVLKKLNAGKKALVVLPERDENVVRAARNLADADTTYVNTLNVYDVLNAGKVILTKAALQSVEEVYA